MEIDTWKSILDAEDVDGIEEAAGNALIMGRERFGEIVLELTEKSMQSDNFSALVSALIVGNLAFDAAPVMQLELSDDITLSVRLDQS